MYVCMYVYNTEGLQSVEVGRRPRASWAQVLHLRPPQFYQGQPSQKDAKKGHVPEILGIDRSSNHRIFGEIWPNSSKFHLLGVAITTRKWKEPTVDWNYEDTSAEIHPLTSLSDFWCIWCGSLRMTPLISSKAPSLQAHCIFEGYHRVNGETVAPNCGVGNVEGYPRLIQALQFHMWQCVKTLYPWWTSK